MGMKNRGVSFNTEKEFELNLYKWTFTQGNFSGLVKRLLVEEWQRQYNMQIQQEQPRDIAGRPSY